MTQFDSNTFENDYILRVLESVVTDLKTQKPVEQILDKYAVELTAFMNGQIRGHKAAGIEAEILEGVGLLVEKEYEYTSRKKVNEWLRRNME